MLFVLATCYGNRAKSAATEQRLITLITPSLLTSGGCASLIIDRSTSKYMPRFLAHVDEYNRIIPANPGRLNRYAGKDVWLSIHQEPSPGARSSDANRYYWGVVIRAICEETGSDPESCHYGLKREAVRLGVLDPCYILLGSEFLEVEPTTVTDVEAFSRYVSWVVDWARTKLDVHVEEAL